MHCAVSTFLRPIVVVMLLFLARCSLTLDQHIRTHRTYGYGHLLLPMPCIAYITQKETICDLGSTQAHTHTDTLVCMHAWKHIAQTHKGTYVRTYARTYNCTQIHAFLWSFLCGFVLRTIVACIRSIHVCYLYQLVHLFSFPCSAVLKRLFFYVLFMIVLSQQQIHFSTFHEHACIAVACVHGLILSIYPSVRLSVSVFSLALCVGIVKIIVYLNCIHFQEKMPRTKLNIHHHFAASALHKKTIIELPYFINDTAIIQILLASHIFGLLLNGRTGMETTINVVLQTRWNVKCENYIHSWSLRGWASINFI